MDKEQTIFDYANKNDIEGVKKCIDNGIDINIQDEDGWTPLMYAHIYLDMTEFLIENGADPFIKNKNNYSALDFAIDNEDGIFEQDEVRRFLRHVMAKEMLSCLEIVESDKTVEEKEEKLKNWIDQGNNINAQDTDKRTALFYITDPKGAELLIKYGIDLLIKDEDGFTAHDYKENELMDIEEKRNCGVYNFDDGEWFCDFTVVSSLEEVLNVIKKAMNIEEN